MNRNTAYINKMRVKCYTVLVDVMSGDRVPALEAWRRIFPLCNPLLVLDEDVDLIKIVYNKKD